MAEPTAASSPTMRRASNLLHSDVVERELSRVHALWTIWTELHGVSRFTQLVATCAYRLRSRESVVRWNLAQRILGRYAREATPRSGSCPQNPDSRWL